MDYRRAGCWETRKSGSEGGGWKRTQPVARHCHCITSITNPGIRRTSPAAYPTSITGRAIERASIAELEALLKEEDPTLDLDGQVDRLEDHIDRFELYRMLLQPLEGVKQSPR